MSGQLATEACEHDVMGYGTVTDWWAKGTEPTVYCQLHTSQEVCVESGEPAGPYCTYKDIRGVISIPVGHPLYKFIGTRYEDVLTEYLGTTVSVGGDFCSLHSSPAYEDIDWNTSESDTGWYAEDVQTQAQDTTLAQDARMLIDVATAQMAGMDPATDQYGAVYLAADSLRSLLDSGYASQNDIVDAMGALSRALAGIY